MPGNNAQQSDAIRRFLSLRPQPTESPSHYIFVLITRKTIQPDRPLSTRSTLIVRKTERRR
jgi:hypothetical protein